MPKDKIISCRGIQLFKTSILNQIPTFLKNLKDDKFLAELKNILRRSEGLWKIGVLEIKEVKEAETHVRPVKSVKRTVQPVETTRKVEVEKKTETKPRSSVQAAREAQLKRMNQYRRP